MPKIVSRVGTLAGKFRLCAMNRDWNGYLKLVSFAVAGKKHRQEFLHRGSAVMVLPVDWRNGLLYLVEQPRLSLALVEDPGCRSALKETLTVGGCGAVNDVLAGLVNTLDVPAGMVEDGEAPEAAAVRELGEETGFVIAASDLEKVADHFSSVGGSTERHICFFASVSGATPQVTPTGDGDETIVTWEYDFREAFQLLRDGKIRHASLDVLLREVLLRSAYLWDGCP